MNMHANDPLASSGLVIVDKPAGWTSHDVVSKLRRMFGTKKVGHAGTLDPMATGVLVVGLNRGTKFLAHMVLATKSYEATIRLGSATTTDDKEGKILNSQNPGHLTRDQINAAVADLTGEIMQVPAAVSSIKIDGKRAHERARAGEEFTIPARPVTVTRFDILHETRGEGFIDLGVAVDCSSGTYIRSLARDLGAALGVGGHLTALRRTAVGPFSVAQARSLEDIEETPSLSLSLDAALTSCYPTLAVTEEQAASLAMGQWLEPQGLKGIHAAVAPDGRTIALVKEGSKRLSTVFVARPNTL